MTLSTAKSKLLLPKPSYLIVSPQKGGQIYPMQRSATNFLLGTALFFLFTSLGSAQVQGIGSSSYQSSVGGVSKSSSGSGVSGVSANNYQSGVQGLSSPTSTTQVSATSSSAGATASGASSTAGGSSTSSGNAATSPSGSEPTKAEDGSPSKPASGTGKFFTCTRCGVEGAETKGYCLGAFGMLSDTNGKPLHHINK